MTRYNNRKPNTTESFWERVKVGKDEECWPWTGSTFKNGYGQLNFQKKNWKTHRLSYTITYGTIPKGMFICHKCDNKLCCNPNHLFLGTHEDNMKDMVNKERSLQGESAPRATLSEEQVLAIRSEYHRGNVSQRQLAEQYNVSKHAIHCIVSRKTWTHI